MVEKLYFKVDPNILDIIRQGYWYEGREKWALDCLRSLGDNMTLKVAYDLLEGNNGLTTYDGGKSLTLTNEPDVEFQKELEQYKEMKRKEQEEKEKQSNDRELQRPFCVDEELAQVWGCKYLLRNGRCLYSRMEDYKTKLEEHPGGECYMMDYKKLIEDNNVIYNKNKGYDEELLAEAGEKIREKNIKKIAGKKGGKCGVSYCKYNMEGKCNFGCRDNYGCYETDEAVQQKFEELKLLSQGMGIQGYESIKMAEYEANKVFNFKFKGKQYGMKDSARNQGKCPHCGEEADDHFWKPEDKAYIGCKYLGEIKSYMGDMLKSYALCFQCPSCANKFFYHKNEVKG